MSMTAHPVWFKDDQGKWSQINGVTDWVIVTPLVARGTYRDKPPAIPGAAAVIGGDNGGTLAVSAAQIIGGVTPVVVSTTVGSNHLLTLSAASTLAQDDDFLHTALRYTIGPEPIILFKTSVTGSPALPDATTYPTERPDVPPTTGGKFPIITGDCVFPWTKNCGLTNTPPQGWTVFTGA